MKKVISIMLIFAIVAVLAFASFLLSGCGCDNCEENAKQTATVYEATAQYGGERLEEQILHLQLTEQAK